MTTIWMEVDLKNKELPTGRMATKARELSRLCGLKDPKAVSNIVSRAKRKGYRCKYVKVEIEEDDNDQERVLG